MDASDALAMVFATNGLLDGRFLGDPSLAKSGEIGRKGMRREKRHIQMSNEAEFKVIIGLSELDKQARCKILRWLNFQHTKKETIPLKAVVKPDHKEAAYNIHRHFPVRVVVRFDKQGNPSLVGATVG